MEISKLFGLPAHPLLVHVPIVLIPLVSIGAIALVIVPAWRARFGWLLVGLAGIALVGVQLALGSGEALEDHVERSRVLHTHTEMASSLRPLALLLFLVVLGLVVLDRRRRRSAIESASKQKLGLALMSVVVVAVSVISTVRLIEVGHNGAKASWRDVSFDSRDRDQDDD